MKNVLVPCDFSRPAVDAFRFAMQIMPKEKSVVHLIHVIELPVLHDTVLMPVLYFEAAMMDELKQKMGDELNKLIKGHKKDGVAVTSEVLFGHPADKTLEYADSQSVDTIIMGSHGAHGFREFMIGSNAEKIVRRAHVPVLVVKEFGDGAVKSIVFPNMLGTEEGQEELVSKVKALQHFFGAKLHLVYINTPLHFVSDSITYSRLESFAHRFGLQDYTLNVYNHPDEEEGIIQFADKIGADMIAIGTHGRKGIAHLLNGSLAEDVVNHTDKLMWTYNQGG